jgi:hypothetical protein
VTDERLRVAVISTGGVGSNAVRAVTRRSDLELGGVWVHSPDKAGTDAGVLAGTDPIGLAATGDLEDIVALAPDCAIYAASGPDLDASAVADYVRLLNAGINVVTTTSPGLVCPQAWIPDFERQVRAAALAGRATMYASGLEPGFAADHLVVLLSTLSNTIKSVRTQEIFDYSSYPNTFMMFDVFGFGRHLDYTPIMSMGGTQKFAWGPAVQLVSDAMHVTLDDVAETYDRALTPRELTVAAGTIPAGTCGAIRMETIGIVNGKPAIVIEHVNRMAPDLAPEWPTAARDGTYRILIEGDPDVSCELTLGSAESASVDGMVATTMRVVNAVPYVVAAQPGIVTALELPITAPHQPFD